MVESKSAEATLVSRAAAGDRDAMGELYNRHFDGVYDFVRRLVRDADEAADVVQDVFVKAMSSLGTLRNEERFRTWLFSIAHNTALNRLEKAKRVVRPAAGSGEEGDDTFLYQQVDTDRLADPQAALADSEMAALVWEAAAGLDRKQYALLDLHVRQGMDSAEIAEVMGVSKGNAYTMVSRLKTSVEESITAFVMMRRGRKECPALNELLMEHGIGELTPEVRRVITKHIEECPNCAENRRRMVSPLALLGAFAPVAAPFGLKQGIFGNVAAAHAAAGPQSGPGGNGGPGPSAGSARTRARPGDSWARRAMQAVRDVANGMPRSRLYMLLAAGAAGFGGAIILGLFALMGGSAGDDGDRAVLGAIATPVPTPTATREPSPTATGTPAPSATPISTPASSPIFGTPTASAPGPAATPTPAPSGGGSGGSTPTQPPSPPPPKPTPKPTATPTPTPVPDTTPPKIGQVNVKPDAIREEGCSPSTSQVSVTVTDQSGIADVEIYWSVANQAGVDDMSPFGSQFAYTIGPFPMNTLTDDMNSAPVTFEITATDTFGNKSDPVKGSLTLINCFPGSF